ncbi:hypothetical protein JTE90_005277 [Oedothorax gibbosus]|uniref:Uncharacterized protein n=1 Tax=Oedothorax gibbosus TaxID=931172 RepID=A0AAV6U4F4_9ARAC|nr:hypothetical protein JTE90_005277 [Oedothorax gibbosus]
MDTDKSGYTYIPVNCNTYKRQHGASSRVDCEPVAEKTADAVAGKFTKVEIEEDIVGNIEANQKICRRQGENEDVGYAVELAISGEI